MVFCVTEPDTLIRGVDPFSPCVHPILGRRDENPECEDDGEREGVR